MALVFGDGQTVTVAPPGLPAVRATPPSSTVTVVPVIGPQGPPGTSGAAGFRFDQSTPATVWTITHNLGRYPVVVTLHTTDLSADYTGFVVQHLDTSTLRVSMDLPTAGVALLI